MNGVTLDAHGQYFQIAGNWCAKSFAGLDLEATPVKRTFNNVTVQPAVAKQSLRMCTDVVGRVNLAFDVVQGNVELAGLDAKDAVGRDCRSVGDRNPVLRIRHSVHRLLIQTVGLVARARLAPRL